MEYQEDIVKLFREKEQWTIGDLALRLGIRPKEVVLALQVLQKAGQVTQTGRAAWVATMIPGMGSAEEEENPLIPKNIVYADWQNIVSKLLHCQKIGLNTLLIGPAGCGKTEAIRKAAEILKKSLRIIPMSLRTREHHIIGRLDTDEKGNIIFKEGPLIQSMLEGGIAYFDELNTAEQDSLIRIDEALDHRKEINIEGKTYKAKEGWWVVASINPLDRYHLGTKMLPAQILSRFPVKLELTYPDVSTEYNLVKLHVPEITSQYELMLEVLKAIELLRTTDLPYIPSVRESIAIAKLLVTGVKKSDAIKMTLIEVYSQWGETAKAKELIESKLGALD